MTTFRPLAHHPAVPRSRQLSRRPRRKSGAHPDDLHQRVPVGGHLKINHPHSLLLDMMLGSWASPGPDLFPPLLNPLVPPNLWRWRFHQPLPHLRNPPLLLRFLHDDSATIRMIVQVFPHGPQLLLPGEVEFPLTE